MNNIIGIRYVGKKASKADTVLRTGAVWAPNQVHNFAEPLAIQLLRHADVFERAPVSIDGETFMGAAVQARKEAAPVAYVNLTGMGADELAVFARREFNRTVETEGRDVADVRADVHRLMITSNMDEIAEELLGDNAQGVPYTMMVSVAEHEALMAGQIVVRLVPAEVADEAILVTEDGQIVEPRHDGDEGSGNQAPTLDELLATLTTKDELLAFSIQENIPGLTGRNSVETMRTKISEAIKAREAGKPSNPDA